MSKVILVRQSTKTRLVNLKQQEGLKSIDQVVNRLLDAAEEARRQGINYKPGIGWASK